MKPDIEEYSLDEVALRYAGINPFFCESSVSCAVHRNLTNAYLAEGYLDYLYKLINTGQITPTRVIPPPPGVMGSDEIYISKEDAERWQPEDLPVKPASSKPKPSNPSDELTGKSRTTFINTIKAFSILVSHYETKRRKPGAYPHTNILKDSGEVNAEALKRLLTDVCPETPPRVDKLIIEAMKDEQ